MRLTDFLLSSTLSAIATVLLTVPFTARSWASPPLSPTELVAEVADIVDADHLSARASDSAWAQQRRTLLSRDYATSEQAYAAIHSALQSFADPYTYFLEPEHFQHMRMASRGDLATVGLSLKLDERGRPTLASPPPIDSPAFASGLQQYDIILAVNDRSTADLTVYETLRRIRGHRGTAVTLEVERQGGDRLVVEMQREAWQRPAVSYELHRQGDREIGYIRLTKFTDRTAADMQEAIDTLEAQQVDAYLLDLRSNPGGMLEASTDIAEMFLDGGTIVTLENRDRVRRIVDRREPLTDKPLAVLVDRGSASSSEVLAGALQAADRATIVGTPTFGKGIVQMMYLLSDGSCLTVTSARYRTPDGRDIHQQGLIPDLEIELSDSARLQLARDRAAIATPSDTQYAAAVRALFETPETSEVLTAVELAAVQ
ncbi:S41 family peptidase [Synechococcus sp. PCC 7336]|uniref:S41 family peptidase n=1 Tax=Synechococcus sp. PCC 7336 TaxID=195250 RepID=UPI00034AEFF7|nr:S41 family peptidase [Synechococcus sp. PCC 7336]